MSRILLLAVLSLASFFSRADSPQLEITISNISEAKGTLLIAVYDNADFWLSTKEDKPPVADASYEVASTDDALVLINDLPAGIYAVSVFHDLNGDQELDTNFIGFPKEPFGFSAPMGKFGPPNFEKASFELDRGIQKIQIKMSD